MATYVDTINNTTTYKHEKDKNDKLIIFTGGINKMENKQISINKHMYFDTEFGHYCLTSEASELIYRQKNLICSYSGANEWIHHFTCEMLDFCSGSSIYNYALGTIRHKEEIAKVFIANKENVINFVTKSLEVPWSKKMYKMIEMIIDEAEVC